MGLLWDRQAIVSFGPKGKEGVRIEGLRVSFDIEKGKENKGTIQIYNLATSSIGLLKTTEPTLVILDVGYGDIIDQLFVGDVQRAFTQRRGGDFVTTIEAKDGGAARVPSLDKSYKAGTSLKDVFLDAVDVMKEQGKIVIGNISAIKDEIAQNGITVSGVAKTIAEGIARKQGLDFTIQDNEAQTIIPTETTGEEAILLTPDTGLIGSPSLGISGGDTAKTDGVTFRALIQTTRFRFARAVKIEAKDFDGLVRIEKAKFTGDTHGEPWFVDCEAVLI